MRTLGVTDLKAHLSKQLRRVKAGEEIIVTEHGRPIARIIPVADAGPRQARVRDQVRRRALRPPQQPLDLRVILDPRRPKDPKRAVLRALLGERENSR